VLFAVLRKTRLAGRREVERAVRVWQVCACGHLDHGGAHRVYEGTWDGE
jgi:hypothetical protein